MRWKLILILSLAVILLKTHHDTNHSPSRSVAATKSYQPESPQSIYSSIPSFVDDFKGPTQDDDPSCFSRKPVCMKAFNGHWNCEEKYNYLPGLQNLNKCNWAIELFPVGNLAIPRAENIFVNPNENTGSGKGVLNLLSTKNKNFTGDLSGSKILAPDCGHSIDPNDPYKYGFTSDCPYYVAHLWSKPRKAVWDFPGIPGFAQKYGRFEVRAKLQDDTLNFPAFWLVPDDSDYVTASWPRDGEIDIMEQFAPGEIGGSYHGATEDSRKDNRHDSITIKYKKDAAFFYNEWHTYAVEWSPGKLKYFVDNVNYATYKTGDNTYRDGFTTKTKHFILPGTQNADTNLEWVPRELAFFWRINTAVSDPKADSVKHYNYFKDSALKIDYVKTYPMCMDEKDFCPFGGSYDATPGVERCEHYEVPKGKKVFIEDKRAYFKNCEENCLAFEFNGEGELLLEDDVITTLPVCANYKNQKTDFSASGDASQFDPYDDSPRIIKRYPVPYLTDTMGGLKIEFNVPKYMKIKFLLYNVAGQLIGTLPDKDWNIYAPGVYIEAWNIGAKYGLASAPYFITMQWQIDDGPEMQTPAKENELGKIIVIRKI